MLTVALHDRCIDDADDHAAAADYDDQMITLIMILYSRKLNQHLNYRTNFFT